MYEQYSEVLLSSALFRDIAPDELQRMLDCLKPRIREYRSREVIALCDSPFTGVGIVVAGKVAVTRETYSGSRILLAILGPGDVFGEMEAFSSSRVWPATVLAREDCAVVFLPPAKIAGNCPNLCPGHSALIMNMLNVLSCKALVLHKKMEHLGARKLRGRISSYLLDAWRQNGKVTFKLAMKRQELADYLNMPRPSLSREMGLMRDEGIIEYSGSSIRIIDLPRLEKATE